MHRYVLFGTVLTFAPSPPLHRYVLFGTVLASTFDRRALQCENLVVQLAAVSPNIVVAGVAMATLSTALGAMFGVYFFPFFLPIFLCVL